MSWIKIHFIKPQLEKKSKSFLISTKNCLITSLLLVIWALSLVTKGLVEFAGKNYYKLKFNLELLLFS